MTAPRVTVTLIGRIGCHLCDAVRQEVLAAQRVEPFDLLELDVDGDVERRAEYGEQVPVILVDGVMHSFFDVDRVMLTRAVAVAKTADP